jgi:DNA-directed RNA polymerase subunit RPC12/RpoP
MPAHIDPEVAVAEMRAAGVEPLEPYPGTHNSWRCRCLACGNEVEPRLTSIRSGQGACRYCGDKRRGEDRRSDPEAAVAEMRAAGLEPLEPFSTTKTPWRSRCMTCGAEVAPILNTIRNGHGGCKACGHTKTANARRTDEGTAIADMRSAGFEPQVPFENTNAPWLSVCTTCGKESEPSLDGVRRGRGCRHCSGNVRLDPDVAIADMRAAGVEPLDPYPGKDSPWRSRCLTCGKEVSPRLGGIRNSGQRACKYCFKDWLGERFLGDPDEAAQEMREAGAEPLEPYTNVRTAWRCRCLTCGHEVSPRLNNVRSGSHPCMYCSSRGFDGTKSGVVYLFRHDKHRALKVGITNDRIERLIQHEREGWSLVDMWSFDVGADARYIESAVLTAWEAYEYGVAEEDMPQAGYTETVSLDDVSEAEALALIESEVARLAESPRLP